MSQKPTSKISTRRPAEPWWQFGFNNWLLIGGLVLFNVGCFLKPALLDDFVDGLFDFRSWPWWYFLCLTSVLAFSVRWFFLYQKYVNDDFDPQGEEEAVWFCRLTGSVTAMFAILIVMHHVGLLRNILYTLNMMFGYGVFSIWALMIFIVILAIIGFFASLTWKWIGTIPAD